MLKGTCHAQSEIAIAEFLAIWILILARNLSRSIMYLWVLIRDRHRPISGSLDSEHCRKFINIDHVSVDWFVPKFGFGFHRERFNA